jgi:hypothetical protein
MEPTEHNQVASGDPDVPGRSIMEPGETPQLGRTEGQAALDVWLQTESPGVTGFFRAPAWAYPDCPKYYVTLFPRLQRIEDAARQAWSHCRWRVPAAWRLLRTGDPYPRNEWDEW